MITQLADASPVLGPVVTDPWVKLLVILAAYIVTLMLSGVVVRFFVLPPGPTVPTPKGPGQPRYDASTVIGKCENIITVSFVLANAPTGLALIFAGKSLVRSADIKKNPGFFLGGTLVNLVWGLLVAMIARVLVFGV